MSVRLHRVLASILTLAAAILPREGSAESLPPEAGLEPAISAFGTPDARAVALREVLTRADAWHPRIAAAGYGVDMANARLLEAEGGFDLRLFAGAGRKHFGPYDQRQMHAGVDQPTALWGARLYGGYRNGADFPVYHGDRVTSTDGKVLVGAELPVWRDGPIDERRLRLRQARLGRQEAEAGLLLERIEVLRSAGRTYFVWLAAGEGIEVEEKLFQLADERRTALVEQAASGAIAPIEMVDNDRLIAARRERVVNAQRNLAQAAFRLSLFYRDRSGRPRIAGRGALPKEPPALRPVPPRALDNALARALRDRPEITRNRLARERLEAEKDWAENQRAPDLRVIGEASRDLGATRRYAPFATTHNATEVGLAVRMEWPVQQRVARGRAEAAGAELSLLSQQLQFMQEAIAVQIRAAFAEVSAAQQRVSFIEEALEAARRMEEAERVRFAEGQSSILTINLREEATADLGRQLVEARLEFFGAIMDFKAATGLHQVEDYTRFDVLPP
jgi:outer membrane protein, heavy metal efflux system